MSDRDVEIVREMLEAWSAEGGRGKYFDAEVEWIMPHPGLSSSNRDEMAAAMADFRSTWDEYEFDIEDVQALGDGRVLALFTERVRGAASGIEQVTHPGAICTLRDGKVVRFEAFIRREDVLRAAGLPVDQQDRS
jgi:ketosteroid isomerase-like protein